MHYAFPDFLTIGYADYAALRFLTSASGASNREKIEDVQKPHKAVATQVDHVL